MGCLKMGFFLLGRGREHGDLRLIVEELFADRQKALDSLSRLSADLDFAHRDADVFVVDLDAAVPVLLVAPAAPPIPEPPAPPAEVAPIPDVVVEVEPEVVPEPELEETAGVWEAPAVPPVEIPEPVVELVPEPIASAVIADAVIPETPVDDDDLADALKRAAGTLEAQGITAPESVGPEQATEEQEAQPVEALTDQAAAPDASWPWEPTAAGEAEKPETASAPEPGFEVPDFEEPALDGTDLLAGSSDDFVMPKPLIMGAYADEDDTSSPFDRPAVAEPASISLEAPVPVLDSPGEDESMLADLETIEAPQDLAQPESPAAPEIPEVVSVPSVTSAPDNAPAELSAEESELASLTCDDCVYVNTCPNKEELEPASCGTFQWKSV